MTQKLDPFEPSDLDRARVRDSLNRADVDLDRDFKNMDIEQLASNYFRVTQNINNLIHVEGGEDLLKERCDKWAGRALEIIINLKTYKKETSDYYDSLRK